MMARMLYVARLAHACGGEGHDCIAHGAQGARAHERTASSFPGSAWERDAREALPRFRQGIAGCSTLIKSRQSLQGSAFPGRAWERGN